VFGPTKNKGRRTCAARDPYRTLNRTRTKPKGHFLAGLSELDELSPIRAQSLDNPRSSTKEVVNKRRTRMKFRTTLVGAMLLPTLAIAQAYDPSTGQRFDAYGRPLPSVEELCREGKMAGGPITVQCGMYDYRFNKDGERLVRYDFEKWGYDVLDTSVTESDARRLDSDPVFRAKYIKAHGYDKHKAQSVSSDPSTALSPKGDSDEQCNAEAALAKQAAQASAQGVPIEVMRKTVAKILNDNHVSTVAYNKYIQMVNRAYAWQQHGYTLNQIQVADFQACKGAPILEVPEIAPSAIK
jgi:hypothetical protein